MGKKPNQEEMKSYLNWWKKQGYSIRSVLIHENDLEEVCRFARQLRCNRLNKALISPKQTIASLKRLKLHENQFAGLHHFGKSATITAHLGYLAGITRYQPKHRNHTVAQRIQWTELQLIMGKPIDEAIRIAAVKYPFLTK